MIDFYEDIKRNKRITIFIVLAFLILISLLINFVLRTFGYTKYTLLITVPISMVVTFSTYWNSDKIALASVRAKKAEGQFKVVDEILDGLIIAAGINKKPELYIIESEQMNAFATGRNPENAVICVTEGLINRLTRQELEAVIAHELTHILNYDIRLSAVVSAMAGIIVIIGDFILNSLWNVDVDDENSGLIAIAITVVLAIITPIIGNLIELAISRRREYIADAGAVALTRNPEAMINALLKISGDDIDLGPRTNATSSMFIEEPEISKRLINGKSSIFSTHPSIEERIEAIKKLK